jgi:hypothetical protein
MIQSVVTPPLARVRGPEAIRHRGHEVILVWLYFKIVVKDVGIAGPPRGLLVVAVASLHCAGRSLCGA